MTATLPTLVLFARWCLLAASFGIVVVFCSAAATKRVEGAAGAAVRIVATLIAPATALAFLGAFVWPVSISLSVAAAVWQGRGSVRALLQRAQAMWNSLSPAAKAACIVAAAALSLRAGAALSTPPIDGDSLLYHLPITAALVQDHSMWFTRALLYPGASELGDAGGAAATGTVNGTFAFQLVQIIALLLVGYAWARRAGASVDGAVAGAIVAGTLPLVVDQAFTSQNDVFACTLLAAACVLWRPAPRLAAISLGLLFGVKLTAFVLAPAVAIVMIVFEGWPFSVRDIAWAVAVAAPWFIRTLVLTGNPAYTAPSLGWTSTIAANFSHSWPFAISALRIYGGIAALAGAAAVVILQVDRRRNSFARALPWLALAAFAGWIVLPNSAESVPATLDQIRQGWSLRYALLLPFVLATTLPIALDRATRLPLAAFIGLAASASSLVRSANLTASDEPLGFVYGAALTGVVVIVGLTVAILQRPSHARLRIGYVAFASAVTLLSAAATAGAHSIRNLWAATYIQWSRLIPASAVALDKRVQGTSALAVVGMRSFPLVGPNFSTRTFEENVTETPSAWLARLRSEGVWILVAGDESGSPDQPGFLKPLPLEEQIARLPLVCLLKASNAARIYGLERALCAATRRPK